MKGKWPSFFCSARLYNLRKSGVDGNDAASLEVLSAAATWRGHCHSLVVGTWGRCSCSNVLMTVFGLLFAYVDLEGFFIVSIVLVLLVQILSYIDYNHIHVLTPLGGQLNVHEIPGHTCSMWVWPDSRFAWRRGLETNTQGLFTTKTLLLTQKELCSNRK